MKQSQVKQVWDEVIEKYLQPADMLNEPIEIEVRNDNGKQFSSDMIQRYFKDNYLNQVFTHPYSPEENGHIESFHKTLTRAIEKDKFEDLEELELRLERFYKCYNNQRPHGSIAGTSPMMFWALWEDDKIEAKELGNSRVQYNLLIDRQDILCHKEINRYKHPIKLSGNTN
ncbi:integrase core domain-containing protein [Portibacter marinus]|uniref:integrase core domain-containing protein n=1 Tax=Portibacter marinus TaxID=2898660 RepID=UPI001F3A2C72|nr:integrase core domain-containing protein [Portibacter marinus]